MLTTANADKRARRQQHLRVLSELLQLLAELQRRARGLAPAQRQELQVFERFAEELSDDADGIETLLRRLRDFTHLLDEEERIEAARLVRALHLWLKASREQQQEIQRQAIAAAAGRSGGAPAASVTQHLVDGAVQVVFRAGPGRL